MDVAEGTGEQDGGSFRDPGYEGRSAGIGRGQGEWWSLASQLGTHHLDAITNEADVILHAGGDHALDPGEGVRTPVGPMGAPVTPGRRQTADVPFGAVVD